MWTIISTNRWGNGIILFSEKEKIQLRTRQPASLQSFVQRSSIYINGIQIKHLPCSMLDYCVCPNCKPAFKFYSGKQFHSFQQAACLSKESTLHKGLQHQGLCGDYMLRICWRTFSLTGAYRKGHKLKFWLTRCGKNCIITKLMTALCSLSLGDNIPSCLFGKTNWKTFIPLQGRYYYFTLPISIPSLNWKIHQTARISSANTQQNKLHWLDLLFFKKSLLL